MNTIDECRCKGNTKLTARYHQATKLTPKRGSKDSALPLLTCSTLSFVIAPNSTAKDFPMVDSYR